MGKTVVWKKFPSILYLPLQNKLWPDPEVHCDLTYPHRPTAGGASVILNHEGRPTRPQHSRTATAISDTEATLVQAAKVLRKAVLHDARNIQGRPTDLSGLAWDINSTHEAKVRLFPSLATIVY